MPLSQREVNWRITAVCGLKSIFTIGSFSCNAPIIKSLAFIDKRPSSLCQPPFASVRLRKLRSKSVIAQSFPSMRASVTSRLSIFSEGTLPRGARKSVMDLLVCRRISLSRKLPICQEPSARRFALPVSEPRAMSAPMVESVTCSLLIAPCNKTLVAGTPLSVMEPALN